MTPPDRATADRRVALGEICAKCHVEFDGQHGAPVLCYRCYNEVEAKLAGGTPNTLMRKAWLEEKPI